MKKITTEEFIRHSIEIHGDKYNYSEVIYVNNITKVKIYCKEHDHWFWQTPKHHLKGRVGCRECKSKKIRETVLNLYGVKNISQLPETQEKVVRTNLKKYGVKHALQLDEFKEKQKNTNLKKYGFEYCSQSPKIQEKMKQTSLKNYGVEYPSMSQEIKDKIVRTNLKKYGVKHALQLDEFKEKQKNTNLKKYGVEYPMQSPEIIEKTKQTMLTRHGVEYPLQSTKIQEKMKQTNMDRYKVEYPAQSLEIQEKTKKLMLKRYNVENGAQKNIPQESLLLLNDPSWLKEQHHIIEKTPYKIGNELQVNSSTVVNYLKKYNIEFKHFYRSQAERDIDKFLFDNGFSIISNTQDLLPGRYEVDIWAKVINKAIEYNGLYWHMGKGQGFHLWKTEEVAKTGTALMHVWEDMWRDKQKETKEMILKFFNDIPQVELLEQITIDLATDNPQIYMDLGYKIISQSPPELYSKDIWDCGKMKLIKTIIQK